MPKRKSGILLHISSLPSEFGIGDFGPGARRFVDFLHESKQRCWQILPVNPTEPLNGYSPYSSSSAFAGNILFISPELLAEAEFVSKDDIAPKIKFSSGMVDYDAVWAYKSVLYNDAYDHFVSDSRVRQLHEKGFNRFVENNAFWLHDYAMFMALKGHFAGQAWTSWPEKFRKREEKTLADFYSTHTSTINKFKFLQYIFFMQWNQLKKYCTHKDVHVIGDLSIYMNTDSCDVWVYPGNYKLDDQFRPLAVSGVPPDFFSDTGQRWGNPVYDWDALRQNRFSWWIERFRWNFQLFDIVRIDHFRGLVQYWEIPYQEKTAMKGAWTDVPTKEFFHTLEKYFSKPLPIIAEDLGHITGDVRAVMRQFDFPGMKVLLFAFNDGLKRNPYLPHNYDDRCVAYTGTHDNNTVLDWFENDATPKEIANLQTYLNKKVSADSVCWDMIRLAFNSTANLAIIPLPDILGLGGQARMNTPATTQGNWKWRATPEMFNRDIIQRLTDITINTRRY